jgi:hypothetical protein
MRKKLRSVKNLTWELADQKSIAEEIAAQRAQLEKAAKRFHVRASPTSGTGDDSLCIGCLPDTQRSTT